MASPQKRIKPEGANVVLRGFFGLVLIVAAPFFFISGEGPLTRIALPIGLVAAGVIMLAGMPKALRAIRAFRARAIQTTATAIKHTKESGQRDLGTTTSYFVTFQFQADKQEVRLRASVPQRLYQRSRHDAEVAVRYDPDNPKLALFKGERGFG